jgi:hypothetical protein
MIREVLADAIHDDSSVVIGHLAARTIHAQAYREFDVKLCHVIGS